MAEKKRKGTDSSAAQPTKKSKKNVKIASEPVVVAEETTTVVEPATIEDASAKPSKRTRKRAADFLYDAPEDDSPKPKKGKKDAKVADEPKSLTADGTNGVVEHSDNEDITITTTKQPKKKSMMAEAERTQDAELAEEYGSDKDESEEDIDTAPALLTGFDSDNEDAAEDKNFDASKLGAIPQFKKTSKKLRKAAESKNDGPGVVYIGRIPHGFYESQMKEYFSQFGTIARLRLSRNKKTGASKHFAFIEFESKEVAKIVADTMDNYLMFGHILKCKYAPAENLHADVWKGANKKYRKIPQHKLLKQKAEQPKTEEQIDKKMKKVQSKREKKLKQLTEMGYEYELPTLVKPTVQVQAAEEKPEPLAIEDKVEGAVIPPSNVPKDEVAVMVEEKQKKAKKEKSKKQQAKTSEETAPAAAEEAPVATEAPKKTGKKGKKDAAVVEPVPVATEDVVAVEEPKRSKRNKKETATEAAPAVIEEVAVEVAKPAKKGKKGKKDEAIVEVVPVVTEETAVVVEEPAPKKGRKAKKEVVVEATPVIVEEATTNTEEAPKAIKKSKKDVEVKGDGKQLKSILKKTKKA